jgi:hypothetical protein
MSQHLTAEDLETFRKKTAHPKELVRIDRHLTECSVCREQMASNISADFGSKIMEDDDDSFHLSYEQIEAYVQSLVDDIDREIVTSHLEFCSECSERVENLQAFVKVLEAPPVAAFVDAVRPAAVRPIVAAAPPGLAHLSLSNRIRSWFRMPALNYALIGTIAGVLVIGIVFLQRNMLFIQNSGATAALINALPPVDQNLINSTADAPTSEMPALLGQVLAAGVSSDSLTEPKAQVIRERRPAFRWRAVPDADSYRVEVHRGTETVAMAEVKGTEWTPDSDLQRGTVYSWSITPYRNGTAMTPPLTAGFAITSDEQEMLLMRLLNSPADSHLLLTSAYLNVGLIDDAERELKLLLQSSGRSTVSAKLSARIAAVRANIR